MTSSVKRPLALITGASSGIGAAFAERLAADGWDLVLVARRGDRLSAMGDRLSAGHGAGVEALVADLTVPKDVAAVEAALADSEVELLVNNAGFSGYMPFVQLPPATISDLIQIHCTTVARLTRSALPGMIDRGRGGVVTVASLLAFSQSWVTDRMAARTTYAACKAFEVAFMVTLSNELAGTGVRSMVCCPGMVETEFHGPDYQGPPRMRPELVVQAALMGLANGEMLCTPGVQDGSLVDRLHEAQLAFLTNTLSLELADRYLPKTAE
jgi:uncharacterized protein